MSSTVLVSAALLALVGCSSDGNSGSEPDANPDAPDAAPGTPDAGPPDAGKEECGAHEECADAAASLMPGEREGAKVIAHLSGAELRSVDVTGDIVLRARV